jgi:hypothetical protein
MKPRWTPPEEETLRALWLTTPAAQIGALCGGKSERSVRQKAMRMGLPCKGRSNASRKPMEFYERLKVERMFYTQQELAKRYRAPIGTVRAWLARSEQYLEAIV